MTGRVQSLAVVGRDAAVWLTAFALKRALGPAGLDVRVVELPTLLRPTDVYPCIPAIGGLHAKLEIEERALLRVTGGVPMTGQRFANWAGSASPFILGYDDPPPPGGDLDFAQYWIKARREGLRTEFEGFSMGATAARAGRVTVPAETPQPMLSASYGYHLDARSYAGLLKHLAERSQIQTATSPSVSVVREGERLAAVVLENGERIEADLFIDASGAEGVLIRQMPGAGFESWRKWLPCDRILTASGAALRPLPAFSQVSAFRAGWIGLHPLRTRTGVIATYASDSISDDELISKLPIITRFPISGDAVVAPFEAGMQRRPWIGNCIAIGETAISLEPLDALPLHLVHSGISHLINLFPAVAQEFPEAVAYNSVMAEVAQNIRDFQIAHYALNRRFDEPLWDNVRENGVPESLDRKLRVFKARGLTFSYDQESFAESSWAAHFLGHGVMPDGHDPRVDLLPEQEHILRVQRRMQEIAEAVGKMPLVDDFIAEAPQQAPEKATLDG